jgi:hypothetical protein
VYRAVRKGQTVAIKILSRMKLNQNKLAQDHSFGLIIPKEALILCKV